MHRRSTAPPTRSPSRRGYAALAAGAAVAVLAVVTPPALAARAPRPAPSTTPGAVTYTYHCSSTAGHSDTEYTLVGTAPAEVVKGSTFSLTNVVISGTVPVDLLLAQLTFRLDAPLNATSVDGLSRTFDGPGSTDPPGPFAPKGSTNSSPPMTFVFVASGPVGSTIAYRPGEVSSIAVEIGNPANRLPVSCHREGGPAFAVTKIIAATTTTTTSTTTTTTTAPVTPDTGAASVLAATATAPPAAAAVAAQPAFTG